MARANLSTAGTQAVAAAAAGTLTGSSGMHTMLPMEHFSIVFRGHTLSFSGRKNYLVETALKTLIQTTDRDVTFSS